jgi:hypothetical protein
MIGVLRFVQGTIAHGTIVYTDGDTFYGDSMSKLQFHHERIVLLHTTGPAHQLLPAVHRVAALLIRWLSGTAHDGDNADDLG